MSSLAVADRIFRLIGDGRLADPSDWTVEVGEALSDQDSLVLTHEHWEVIDFLRAYYREFGISPILKLLKRGMQQRFGEAKSTDEHLAKLFPGGVIVQGTKIAGVPVPHFDVELNWDNLPAEERNAGNENRKEQQFEFEGEVYRVNKMGNLLDLHSWNERVAEHMAEKEGVQLTSEHWQVLNYLRKFFFAYGITPMVKILIKHLAEEFGQEKADHDYLYQLFPKGPSRQGSRIAGLPAPQGCIDPY